MEEGIENNQASPVDKEKAFLRQNKKKRSFYKLRSKIYIKRGGQLTYYYKP